MSVIMLLVFILVLALLFYATSLIPDAKGQTIARVAILVFGVIWLLQMFGLLGAIGDVRVK